jgi:hypothetical protein
MQKYHPMLDFYLHPMYKKYLGLFSFLNPRYHKPSNSFYINSILVCVCVCVCVCVRTSVYFYIKNILYILFPVI